MPSDRQTGNDVRREKSIACTDQPCAVAAADARFRSPRRGHPQDTPEPGRRLPSPRHRRHLGVAPGPDRGRAPAPGRAQGPVCPLGGAGGVRLRVAPWGPGYVNAQWRHTLRVAKVRYRNPEQLRHTFASTLLSRNAPPLYVQQQGGWRSAAVLFRVYAQWMPQGEPDATPAQPAPEAKDVPS